MTLNTARLAALLEEQEQLLRHVRQRFPVSLQLIGLSAINHSTLDYFLQQLVFRLAHLSPAYGVPLIGTRGTKAQLESLNRLAVIRFSGAQLAAFKAFIKAAKAVNKKRNDVFHGLWALDQSGRLQRIGEKALYSESKPDFEKLAQLELEHLKELNKKFERLIEEAVRLYTMSQEQSLKAIRDQNDH